MVGLTNQNTGQAHLFGHERLGRTLSSRKRTHMLSYEPASVGIDMTVFARIVAISSLIIVASALSLPAALGEDIARRTAIPSASDSAREALSPPIQRLTCQPGLRPLGRTAKVGTCSLNYETLCVLGFATRLSPMISRQAFSLP
jgi:hypothetical protein